MRKKLSTSLVGAVVCGFLSVCCSVGMITAYADSYWVSDFVCVPQKKSQWCWAASAEASARHSWLTDPKWMTVGDQVEAVKFIYGSELNLGATIEQTASAATHLTYDTVEYKSANTNCASEFLTSQVEKNRVTIIVIGDYVNGSRTGGHAYTVQGMTWVDSTSTTGYASYTKYINCYDPLYFCSVRFNIKNIVQNVSDGKKYDRTCYY